MMMAPAMQVPVGVLPAQVLAADACPNLERERERLVRLCAALTRDWDVAEDLAHEALLIAQRKEDRLHSSEQRWAWIASIARNVCLHWRRDRAREGKHRARPIWSIDADGGPQPASAAGPDAIPSNFDLGAELERDERAALLDRAMGLLPQETRRAMVGHYVEGQPQAQLAIRLGLTEGALAMRLQRGRRALREVLSGQLRDEAAAFGWVDPEREDWQETRIWCWACGARKLQGRFNRAGQLCLDCPDCSELPADSPSRRSVVVQLGTAKLFEGVSGFKPALNRLMARTGAPFGTEQGASPVPCAVCRRQVPWRAEYECASHTFQMRARCPECGNGNGCIGTTGIALALPQGRTFWTKYPRLRRLPDTEIHAAGHEAVVTRLRSVTSNAELAVVFRRDTLRVLRVHGAPKEITEKATDA
jgi:RNA polymerase sigma factor (sigma-70 family)